MANNEHVDIGQDRRHSTGQDDFLNVGRNHTIQTAKDRMEEVGNSRRDKTAANHWTDIGGYAETKIEGYDLLEVGQKIHRKTTIYELQTGEKVVFKGPGGTITIDGSGTTQEQPTTTMMKPNTPALIRPDITSSNFRKSTVFLI